MKRWSILLLVMLLIGGGALMACKSSKKSTKSPTPTKSATTTSGTPKATSQSTPSSSTGGPNLNDLIDQVGKKPVKATYTFAGTGATEGETFTLYYKPPDSRIDVTSGGTTSILISAGGTDYICDESSQTCSVSPVPLGTTLPFLAFLTNPETLSSAVGSGLNHSTDSIGGQNADCYSAGAAGATSEVCFNGDGILVRVHVSVGGAEYTMEATSVSGTVSDSDLQPPYPVQ